jgi:hypothetical protein
VPAGRHLREEPLRLLPEFRSFVHTGNYVACSQGGGTAKCEVPQKEGGPNKVGTILVGAYALKDGAWPEEWVGGAKAGRRE